MITFRKKIKLRERSFYKLLNKDIRELNGILVALFSIVFLVGVGFLSYIISNSYALFGDSIIGEKTMEVEVGAPNLDISVANIPVLDEGMIPVYYDETSDVWKKADSTNANETYKWYDYDNKMWANSVTVYDFKETKYLSKQYIGDEVIVDFFRDEVNIYGDKPTLDKNGNYVYSENFINATELGGTTTYGELAVDYFDGVFYIKISDYEYDSYEYTGSNIDVYGHLVEPGIRDEYQNADLGTEIPMDDILTMQVWIPRYKYKVFGGFECSVLSNPNSTTHPECYEEVYIYNDSFYQDAFAYLVVDGWVNDGNDANAEIDAWKQGECNEICFTEFASEYPDLFADGLELKFLENNIIYSSPQEIEIIFEKGTETTGEIECTDNIQGEGGDGTSETCQINGTTCTDDTCNNKYYTHPAFTFGEEEVEGFWIGKFELTGDIDNITTKPNLSSLRSQNISSFATNIMAMNDSNNQYGFNTSTDTHMIKNMEWGAVAYLSHSKYGTCTNGTCHEVGINNNSEFITGCGAEAGSSSSSTCNSYETELGQNASTTGNIYGVYDMSGGSLEYIMGNIVSTDGTTMMSGNSTSSNSGYTGIIYNGGNYTSYVGTYNYPEGKYYDKYSYGTGPYQIIRSKLGDGIKEVLNTSSSGWYSDYSKLAYSSYPWFDRGGGYYDASDAGVMSSNYANGYASTDSSSRLIITP